MNLSKVLNENKKVILGLSGDKVKNLIKIIKFIGNNTEEINLEDLKSFYNRMFSPCIEYVNILEDNEDYLLLDTSRRLIRFSKKDEYQNKTSIIFRVEYENQIKWEFRWNWSLFAGALSLFKDLYSEEDAEMTKNIQELLMMIVRKEKHWYILTKKSFDKVYRYALTVVEQVVVHNDKIDFIKNSNQLIATSLDTKKEINVKTQESMTSSQLNNIFNYVEFDNEVNLNKVGLYEDKLIQFIDTTFPMLKNKTLKFRLRKLGKHKAIGLYAERNNEKTVVVDFRDTSATVHELAHSFDFSQETPYSHNKDFYNISSVYKANLGEVKKRAYYTNTHEIFARAFEYFIFMKQGYLPELSKDLTELPTEYKPFELVKDKINDYFVSIGF